LQTLFVKRCRFNGFEVNDKYLNTGQIRRVTNPQNINTVKNQEEVKDNQKE